MTTRASRVPRSAWAIQQLLREDLRGRTPYGAPQLDVPVALNTNENSYAVPQAVVDDIVAAVAAVASGLNRYPDREFTDLRGDLAAYLSRSGTAVSPEQVWAGNGSNEVLLHLLQAFGGQGRTALGFTPAGLYRDVGWKHGRWHDVAWVQKTISVAADPPVEPH